MWWTLLLSPALAQECEKVSIGDIVGVDAPAVIVLGERKAHTSDLDAAGRIVSKLAKRGTVTLALECVHRRDQSILQRFENGELKPTDLPLLMQWTDADKNRYWDFPFAPYEKLVTSALLGVNVVAVGLDLGPRPPDESMPLPPGYMNLLIDAFGENPIAVELEGQFVQTVAWRDHAIARAAVEAWDKQGYLVILADRFHVEGGLGVSWQAQRLVGTPVYAFLLGWADTPCYRGDKLLK